jgi:putative transposase
MQGDVAEATLEEFRQIADDSGLALLECEAIVDHVHLLIECDSKPELVRAMHRLKGASARRINERFPELRLDAETNHIWQKGYGSKIVAARDVEITTRYIRTQWDRLEGFEKDNRLKA